MKKKSSGIQFMAPDQSIQVTHIMTGFVDDTTHWLNNFSAALQGTYTKFEMYMTVEMNFLIFHDSIFIN